MRTELHIYTILALAASMVSCEKSIDTPIIEDKPLEVVFNCSSAESKTAYNGGSIWWNEGDSLRFYQLYYKTADATTMTLGYARTRVKTTAETYTTSINFSTPAKESVEYFAVYPDYAYVSTATSSGSAKTDLVRLKLTSTQVPTANSYDPHADLLISQHIVSNEKQTNFNLGFKRLIALGKMSLTNIPSDNTITKVVFSAKKSGQSVHLAGEKNFNIEDGTVFNEKTYASAIAMDYSALNLTSPMTANFCCHPFELAEGDSFTTTVYTTDGRYYTKEASIPAGKDLIFERGRATQFTVDMSESFFRASTATTASSITVRYYGNKVAKVIRAFFKASDLSSLSESEYETKAFAKPSTYGSTLYTALNTTNLEKINNEGSVGLVYSTNAIASGVSIEANTDYVVMLKATSTTGATKFVYFKVKTAAE